MSHQPRGPIWPFLIVLLRLFVLSVTSLRGWERLARKCRRMSQSPVDGSAGCRWDDAAGQHKRAAHDRRLHARPDAHEPIATNLAKADPAKADLVAVDGPHLAEIVETVLAELHEKIAGSRAEEPSSSTSPDTAIAGKPTAGSPSTDIPTADSSFALVPSANTPTADTPSVASQGSGPSPTETSTPAPPAAPSGNPPTTELRLTRGPRCNRECPTSRMRPRSRTRRFRIRRVDIVPAAIVKPLEPPVDLLRRLESLGHAGECSHRPVRTGDLVRELNGPGAAGHVRA